MNATPPADRPNPRSVADVQNLLKRGVALDFLFFYGHHQAVPGQLDASCLSQWWPSYFTVHGSTYRTAEHWMMAHKADLFGDSAARARILDTQHPKDAKQIGRSVRGFDAAVWEARRFDIVVACDLYRYVTWFCARYLSYSDTGRLVSVARAV